MGTTQAWSTKRIKETHKGVSYGMTHTVDYRKHPMLGLNDYEPHQTSWWATPPWFPFPWKIWTELMFAGWYPHDHWWKPHKSDIPNMSNLLPGICEVYIYIYRYQVYIISSISTNWSSYMPFAVVSRCWSRATADSQQVVARRNGAMGLSGSQW